MISGGSLALHKTSWRLLAWEMKKGELKLISATKEVTMMGDGKGAYAVIDFKSPDVANERLGYRICPNGNQDHVHAAIMADMRKLCGRISLSQFLEKEARQVLYQRLVPKLEYKMQLTSLMKKQCKPINTLSRQVVLPPNKVQSKYAGCSYFWNNEL